MDIKQTNMNSGNGYNDGVRADDDTKNEIHLTLKGPLNDIVRREAERWCAEKDARIKELEEHIQAAVFPLEFNAMLRMRGNYNRLREAANAVANFPEQTTEGIEAHTRGFYAKRDELRNVLKEID